MGTISRQEMFDRAFLGLASQGFTRCTRDGDCVYLDDDGRRCAWGWVDPELNSSDNGDVGNLRDDGRGIAATLDPEHIHFAMQLQDVHDSSEDASLELRLRNFARDNHLTIPVIP